MHPDVDAVICGSDQIARGALDTLREHERRVPEDVAVAGHDNWEVIAAHSRPRLTSVDMNLEERSEERRVGKESRPRRARAPGRRRQWMTRRDRSGLFRGDV